jgi:UPF0271 protein
MKAIVLDTSAFIQGYNPGGTAIETFTVPLVRGELKESSKTRFDNAAASGVLKVLTPEEHYLEMVENATMQMGESEALSRTDKHVLALGLQLANEDYEPILVSEDYSVQNMAKELDLDYQGLATPGIKKKIEWEIYCPGCRKTFQKPQPEDICPICGTKLKRRPKN